MKAVDEKTSDIAGRLESEDERGRFVDAEKIKLAKIAEHQAKIAERNVNPAREKDSELNAAQFLKKYPDRVAVHEAIDDIKSLGYLHPIERYTLIKNIIQVIKQSNLIDQSGSDLDLIKTTFEEVQQTERSPNAVTAFQGQNNTWINNGTHSKQIPIGEEIPEGWVLGRVVTERMKEHQKRITAVAAIINKSSLGNAVGSRWYTNGELNIQVRPGVKPPEGFVLGRHFNIEQKKLLLKNLKRS